MRKPLAVVFLCMTISGCALKSGPPQTLALNPVEQISEFEGVYQNLGQSAEGNKQKFYLSKLVWPYKNLGIDHSSIKTIEVKALGNQALTIKDFGENELVREVIYVEGKDFQLKGGQIELTHESGFSGFKAGDPIVGPYSQKTTLGLDRAGNGKFIEKTMGAGLVYMVVPVAIKSQTEVRFVKIK